jgi:hypothetical protein
MRYRAATGAASSPESSQPARSAVGLLLLRHALLGLLRPSLSAETFEIGNFLIAPCPIGAKDYYANVDAFIADEHLWSGDQVFDSMLALAAKRTVQLNLLPHGRAPRLARETNSPAHRIGLHGFNGLRAKSRGYCHRDSTAFTAVPPREIALPKLAGLCSQPAF